MTFKLKLIDAIDVGWDDETAPASRIDCIDTWKCASPWVDNKTHAEIGITPLMSHVMEQLCLCIRCYRVLRVRDKGRVYCVKACEPPKMSEESGGSTSV